MVSQRRQLLDYVKRKDVARYQRIIEKLDPPTPSPAKGRCAARQHDARYPPAPVLGAGAADVNAKNPRMRTIELRPKTKDADDV